MHTVRTVLAFDFGLRRIGAAVGQDLSRTAQALGTIKVKQHRPDWDGIGRLVHEWQPDLFVLGRPETADGKPHSLAAAIERFAGQLHGRYGKPVHFIDERLSSYAAEGSADAARLGVDAAAARIILETWFETIKPR